MKRNSSTIAGCALLMASVTCCSALAADWPTNRGTPARTGNIDSQPGPKAAKILWTYESTEHFIASPVIADNALIVSGLGAFNTPALYALSLDPQAKDRVIWKKGPPALKQPTVCAPAVINSKLIFGDGMHQTDGGTLHCRLAADGVSLWQLPVPGTLIHLEGAPTVANGKVYISGGAAGVLCVDMNELTLDGQPVTLPQAQKIIQSKWKELLAKYEEEKKKDPDFAIPPTEDALPKPQPKKLWQFGQDKLHVDTAVAVIGDRVLAGSSYLDDEKVGERAIYCLDPATSSVKWKTPLDINPWAGATAAGDTVIVGCSSIRFDPKLIPNARGQVLALDLNTGQPRWKKDLPAGVISSIAVADDLAIFTATDGKIRALSVKDGQDKWTYDAKAPFFAAPAIAGGIVYAGDLKGVIHAVSLKDGKPIWKQDLAAAPTSAPGMVYGSPIVHAGRLYVATCNLETGQQRTVVVCIGER